MKGFFFSKPLEYRLETAAETLVQGEDFQGTLSVANRGGETLGRLALQLGLAYGNFKKIKANEADAYQPVLSQQVGKKFSLQAGAEHRAEWAIALPPDCPITSTEGALFLIYGGNLEQPGAWSKIDLRVGLATVLETFVTTMENHFAFAATTRKHDGGYTEVRFKPPTSYPTMEEMGVRMRLREKEGMELRFQCRLRKFDRNQPGAVTTAAAEWERSYPQKDYELYNGQPNRELYKTAIAEALAEIAPPPVRKN
ncbi:MAG: hypothetical protein V3S29_07030 [bacterium]